MSKKRVVMRGGDEGPEGLEGSGGEGVEDVLGGGEGAVGAAVAPGGVAEAGPLAGVDE
jgi:hypothetical protein